MKEKLREIWRNSLLVSEIDDMDNFFGLGGDSISASDIVLLTSKEFNIKLGIDELYNNPTLLEFYSFLENSKLSQYTSISVAEKKETYPVTSAQRRMYALNQFEQDNANYNVTTVKKIKGELDLALLKNSVNQLVDRHEILRTIFIFEDGELVQKVSENINISIDVLDDSNASIEEQVRRYIKPFDLEHAPLFRVGVIPRSKNEYVMILDIHHIIADAKSISLIFNEIFSLYEGRPVGKIEMQYKDFTLWQNKQFNTLEYKKQERYWLSRFDKDIPVLNISLDKPRPKIFNYTGGTVKFSFDVEMTQKIKSIASIFETSLYTVLLSIYNILLSKYTAQEDVIVGTPVNGRLHFDVSNMIGNFVNTIPLRNYPNSKMKYSDFLKDVKNNTNLDFSNQEYQLEMLVKKINVARDLSRNPLFDTVFVMLYGQDLEVASTLFEIEPIEFDENIANFDLVLSALEYKNNLRFKMVYAVELFTQQKVEKIASDFIAITNQVIKDIDLYLSEIEMHENIANSTISNGAEQMSYDTVLNYFNENALKNPESIAVVCGNDEITYGQLHEKSNRIATSLLKKGAAPNQIVGIMMDRSIEMIAGILGILKSGAAYLPLDPDYPASRLNFMLEDSQTQILVLSHKLEKTDIYFKGEILVLSDISEDKEADICEIKHTSDPSDLAYIIYTSGTTGQPKGVMVEHGNLVSLFRGTKELFNFTGSDVWALFHSFCFDFSVWEIFSPLLYGGTLVIVPKVVTRDTSMLMDLLIRNKVTVLNQTPTSFYKLLNEDNMASAEQQTHLRYIILGGEMVNPVMLKIWKDDNPQVKLVNMYGITETTVHVTYKEITQLETSSTISNIGRPISTLETYIMDDNLNEVLPGQIGELFVGGQGVASGYLNRSDLTSEKFILYPNQSNNKIYRTGDLVRLLENGELEYIGRADHQVKVRGYRIELGEIEKQLLLHPLIRDSVVTVYTDTHGQKSLCAYYISYQEINSMELREYLKRTIPDYMLPSYFISIDEMPQTVNGKFDRSALPLPTDRVNTGSEYQSARNAIEEVMVAVWSKVLGIAGVSIEDDFFALGGDSIKSIQISAELKRHGLELRGADILTHATISYLSKLVKSNQQKIDQSPVSGRFSLTPIQLWFFKEKFPIPNYYNQSISLYRFEGWNKEMVSKVIKKIVEHHDMLRATFSIDENGQFIQELSDYSCELEINEIILDDDVTQSMNKKMEELDSSMALNKGPLLKVALFKTDKGDYLYMTVHHLVVDGVSWRILIEDLWNGYSQCLNGNEISFPDKSNSYLEWSKRLNNHAGDEMFTEQLNYWNTIVGAESISLAKPNLSSESLTEKSLMFSIDSIVTEHLMRKANSAYNTEINDLLLTALSYALRRWMSSPGKITILLEGHGREEIFDDIDISRTVGWFTTMYPVHLQLPDLENVQENHIVAVKESLRKIPMKGIGYGVLKHIGNHFYEKKPEIYFNYLGQFDQGQNDHFSYHQMLELKKENQNLESGIQILGIVINGELVIKFSYVSELYTTSEIEVLTELFKRCLNEIVDHCVGLQKQQLTPSDLTYSDISFDELDELDKLF